VIGESPFGEGCGVYYLFPTSSSNRHLLLSLIDPFRNDRLVNNSGLYWRQRKLVTSSELYAVMYFKNLHEGFGHKIQQGLQKSGVQGECSVRYFITFADLKILCLQCFRVINFSLGVTCEVS